MRLPNTAYSAATFPPRIGVRCNTHQTRHAVAKPKSSAIHPIIAISDQVSGHIKLIAWLNSKAVATAME